MLGTGRNSLVCSTGHAQGSAASSPARVGGHGSCSLSTSAEVPPLKYSSRVIPAAEAISHTRCLSCRTRKKNKKILESLHNPSNECNQGHAAINRSLPTSQCIEVRLYSSSSMETLIFTQWHSEQLLLTHILQHSRKKMLLWDWVCFFFYSAGETRTNCSIWKVILGPSTPARWKRTALKAREVCLCIDTRAVGVTACPKSACCAEASRVR